MTVSRMPPAKNHTRKPSRSDAISSRSDVSGCSSSVVLAAPNTSPPTNAAMNALAPVISARPNRKTGRTRMATARPRAPLRWWMRLRSSSQAASSPTVMAEASARPTGISPTCRMVGCDASSSTARAARASRTMGVASPSFSPLSTLSARRTRVGTTGLSTVGAPSPASVGVIAAATSHAPATPTVGRSDWVTRKVAISASGKPMASRRTAIPGSCRSAASRTVDASWNRIRTRVISAMRWTAVASTLISATAKTAAPAITLSIGAVTFASVRRRATNE